MANAPNQKLKRLYILRILTEQTDDEHPMSVKDLIGQLDKYGITAERKSLYSENLDCKRERKLLGANKTLLSLAHCPYIGTDGVLNYCYQEMGSICDRY